MESIKRNQATVAQIRALEDAAVNPLTGEAWPEGHKELLESRRSLPVYGRFAEILGVYHQNQVLVLSSETGSGKSTQVPQLLVYDEYESGLRVACTQPKRIAATKLGERVAEEMGVTLGEEVGYQIGGDIMVDKNKKKTRLQYMTEGSLLGKLLKDRKLPEFSAVIIDEAHERTIEIDLLMMLLKRTLKHRKDLKIIIMSATVDAKLFQEYFDDCPLVHITGRNFKVDIRYVEPSRSYFDLIVETTDFVTHIHETHAPGNILVFLPGQSEISAVCGMLKKYTEGLDIFPLYSKLESGSQELALKSSGPNRKCIVSTNIAETSLTIEGVVYVVDTGLEKQLIYDHRLGIEMLRAVRISQASAKQRTGRAGRTQDGVCYRLYSKQDFDRLALSTKPMIQRAAVHSATLKLLAAGHTMIVDLDWIDAPSPEAIARATQDLQDWGFLQDNCVITMSGHMASRCPLDPIWFHAIEEGAKLGCAMDIVDIAAICTSQRSIFASEPKHQPLVDEMRRILTPFPSDHLALANIFEMYMHERSVNMETPGYSLAAWCKRHFLDKAGLDEARLTIAGMGHFLKSIAKFLPTRATLRNKTAVPKALARGLCTQIAIANGGGNEYRTVHEDVPGLLAPTSSLLKDENQWIVYSKLSMVGNKVLMGTASAIDPEWLVDLAYFKEDRLPLTGDGSIRQPKVKESLDAAKAEIEASKAT